MLEIEHRLHREIFTVVSDQDRQRAERSFEKEQRAQDGRAAVMEYEAEARAIESAPTS
jgi:hypothetical protein